MEELNNRQKACCLKITSYSGNSHKATKYMAALIGSGATPEQAPKKVKDIFKAIGMAYNKDNHTLTYKGSDRRYSCKEYWSAVLDQFSPLNLPVEIRFQREFVEN